MSMVFKTTSDQQPGVEVGVGVEVSVEVGVGASATLKTGCLFFLSIFFISNILYI
jgi:hypothetical protein